LSPGIRSTLLSLQATAARTNAIQSRLATGKRVVSALDNPKSFFTAQSLNARANALNVLLDNVAQAQQTVKTVTQSITALSKLVQSARSLAQQARQAEQPQTSYDAIEVTGSASVSSETAGAAAGNVDTSGGFTANVNGLQIQVGATVYTVASTGPESINAIISRINGTAGLNGAVTAGLDVTGTFLELTANSTDVSFQVLNSAAATALGVAGQSGTSTNLIQAVSGLSGTSLTVQSGGGGATTINFGTGAGQVSTLEELQSALASAGVYASLTGANLTLGVAATTGHQNSLVTSGSALAAFGMSPSSIEYGAVSATTPDPSRTIYQAQYNSLLEQIDALTGDSSYNGINLLSGGSLAATFNESGSSTLSIAGTSLNVTGLGLAALTGDDFQSDAAVEDIVGDLDDALTSLRIEAARLGSNLAILQVRQDFTKAMAETLKAGADDLVLTDSNEEGANLLALQTRQALSTTALSLSSMGAQAVLRLFQ
jgi:flagellin-like hook-associated protein FlgL